MELVSFLPLLDAVADESRNQQAKKRRPRCSTSSCGHVTGITSATGVIACAVACKY